MTRILTAILLVSAAPVLAQAPEPVADPTGTLVGEIDGVAFDLPVICEQDDLGMLQAMTHRIAFNSDPAAVDAALSIVTISGMLAVTALVNDDRYEFGVRDIEAARAIEWSGTITSADGDYGVTLDLDCDG